MKQIGIVNLGLAFAGCFLGAGYVSGQELWQFFGSFGAKGAAGLLISLALIMLVGVMMLALNRMTGITEADKLTVMWDIKPLRIAVTVLELVFLFGVCTIMSAGVGALMKQLFDIPLFLGSGVFAFIVAVVSLTGFSGMVKAFSFTVPLLCAATVYFGADSLLSGADIVLTKPQSTGTLMGSWVLASLSFACYNIFGSIAMIAPLGGMLGNKKTAYYGILFGGLVLLAIAGSVLIAVCSAPEFTAAELPMLALASEKGAAWGIIYGMLLLFAMFGTSLSSLVGFVGMLGSKSVRIEKHRTAFTFTVAVGFFLGSLFGFGKLIGIVYPIFGYLSSVFIVLMTIHYLKVKRNVRVKNKA